MADPQTIHVDRPGETVAERRARWLSVSISPSATPTRNRGAEVATVGKTESRWAKDHDAYRRLRKDGLQPKALDGAANIEARANTADEVTMGHLFSKEELPKVREGMQMAQEMGLGQ